MNQEDKLYMIAFITSSIFYYLAFDLFNSISIMLGSRWLHVLWFFILVGTISQGLLRNEANKTIIKEK